MCVGGFKLFWKWNEIIYFLVLPSDYRSMEQNGSTVMYILDQIDDQDICFN